MTDTFQRADAVAEGAAFLETVVRYHVQDDAGIPAETCITCAAWMAGTLLFRLEEQHARHLPRGCVVLSDRVNQRLPALMGLVGAMAADGEPAAPEIDQTAPPQTMPPLRLTLAQAQDLLDPVYLSYARRHALTPEQALMAATRATGQLAARMRHVLGLPISTHLAQYGLLEASKTAPRWPQRHDFAATHLKRFASILPRRSVWQQVRTVLNGWAMPHGQDPDQRGVNTAGGLR
ncbi:hypothetical protein [Hydrogenophaga sp.]|uniref:hypothetical protein n=1 Tax=Hydrogenophaga sp. TaxID=1904254 RepID=UPI003D0CB820